MATKEPLALLSEYTVNWRITPITGVGERYLNYKGVKLYVSDNTYNFAHQRWIEAPTLQEAVEEAIVWLSGLPALDAVTRPKKKPKPKSKPRRR